MHPTKHLFFFLLLAGTWLFFGLACNHAKLSGFAALPKQSALIFQTSFQPGDSLAELSSWPGWPTFQQASESYLPPLEAKQSLLIPFCLNKQMQWLGIWELEASSQIQLIGQSGWESSSFQQNVVQYNEAGWAFCQTENLVIFGSMAILVEDALRAIAEEPASVQAIEQTGKSGLHLYFLPQNLREAALSCWNLPHIQPLVDLLPPVTGHGAMQAGKAFFWKGLQNSPVVEYPANDTFPFWQLLPVDLVWGAFYQNKESAGNQVWAGYLQGFDLSGWFMAGSLDNRPHGETSTFYAFQVAAPDSMDLPGLPDPYLLPNFPMVPVHRVEAQGALPECWIFQLESVLFLIPDRDQAKAVLRRYINNQTLEASGALLEQSISAPFIGTLYYRSDLDDGWYASIWGQEVDPSLRTPPWEGTWQLALNSANEWVFQQNKVQEPVPPRSDQSLDLPATILEHLQMETLNGEDYFLAITDQGELVALDEDLRPAWSRRLPDLPQWPVEKIKIVNQEYWLLEASDQIFVLQQDGSNYAGYPLPYEGLTGVYPMRGQNGAFWGQTPTSILAFDLIKDPMRPVWEGGQEGDSLSFPLKHYQVPGADLVVGILEKNKVLVKGLSGETQFDTIFLEQPAIAAPTFQSVELSDRLIIPLQDGRVAIISPTGASFNLKMQSVQRMEKWAVGDLVGDNRFEYFGSSGRQLIAMGYQGKEFNPLFQWEAPGEISAIRVHQVGPHKLLSILDQKARQVWVLDARGTVLRGFPVAGMSPPVFQKHPSQKGYRILTTLDRTVTSYLWSAVQ